MPLEPSDHSSNAPPQLCAAPAAGFALALEGGTLALRVYATDGAQLPLSLLRALQKDVAASPFSAASLYEALRPAADAPTLPAAPPGLLPVLRRYQSAAAAWMVSREQGGGQQLGCSPVGWRQLGAEGAFCCEVTGRVRAAPPPPPPLVRGGILADEMGLGKTVTVLALLLAHRCPSPAKPPPSGSPPWRAPPGDDCVCGEPADADADACRLCCGAARHVGRGRALCRRCAAWLSARRVPGQSGATLIVMPGPIVGQWQSELARHSEPGALAVLVYAGQPRGPFCDVTAVVTPAQFAAADVVLTSYEALRADIHRDDSAAAAGGGNDGGSSGRRATRGGGRRYPPLASPLLPSAAAKLAMPATHDARAPRPRTRAAAAAPVRAHDRAARAA